MEIANLFKNFLLGHHLKQPTYPKNYSSDLISSFDCVLSSSDRLITPINCYKTHHQPNSFTHSHKFIVLGSLGPYPIPSGFGLQFVTLQDLSMACKKSKSKRNLVNNTYIKKAYIFSKQYISVMKNNEQQTRNTLFMCMAK